MVLVADKLLKIIELYKLLMHIFGLAVVRRLLHAGRSDILPPRTDGDSLVHTNKNHSAYWPYCRGHALPPHWLKACNPARNGGVDDHHHRVYHGVVF